MCVTEYPQIVLFTQRTVQTVYNAIKAGYRLFDGAGDYGNEKEAGEGVARAIKDGLVKREDLCECMRHSFEICILIHL